MWSPFFQDDRSWRGTQLRPEAVLGWYLMEATTAGFTCVLGVEGAWRESINADRVPERRVGLGDATPASVAP